jgi:hypothetical protein
VLADTAAGLGGFPAHDVGTAIAVAGDGAAVDNECLATLRTFLVEMQGLDASAADVIVRRHWAPGSHSGLNSVWRQWLAHCDTAGITFSSPTVSEFINFLQKIYEGTYRAGNKLGVATSAGWVRSVRSGVSSTLALMTASGDRLGAHSLVTAYVAAVIKTDLLDRNMPGVRYDDTWDATLLLDYWMEQLATADLSYSRLLDKAISLARIHMCSRSSDLATMWFDERMNGRTVDFLTDGDGALTGVKVRYFNPKTGRYLAFANGFTAWETFLVGAEYPPELDLATVLYELYNRVQERGSTAVAPAVFLSVRKGDGVRGRTKGEYHALRAGTLASRMKAVMLASGVPADFKAHSARAAGGALLKVKGASDDAIMDRMRLRSKYIYKKHYKRDARPVAEHHHPRAAPISPVEELSVSSIDSLDSPSSPLLAGYTLLQGSAGGEEDDIGSGVGFASPVPPSPPSTPAVIRRTTRTATTTALCPGAAWSSARATRATKSRSARPPD